MKKFLYPILLFVLALASCSSEDELSPELLHQSRPSTLKPSDVVGKWKFIKVVVYGDGVKVTPATVDDVLHLKADSSFIRNRAGKIATGTFSIVKHSEKEWGVLTIYDDKTVSHHQFTWGQPSTAFQDKLYLSAGDGDFLLEDGSMSDGPVFYYQKIANQ